MAAMSDDHDDYRAHLLAKHGGDHDKALREACWTVCMLGETADRDEASRIARQAKPPIKPLDVSQEDSPHG